jgi:hypothetical protein
MKPARQHFDFVEETPDPNGQLVKILAGSICACLIR